MMPQRGLALPSITLPSPESRCCSSCSRASTPASAKAKRRSISRHSLRLRLAMISAQIGRQPDGSGQAAAADPMSRPHRRYGAGDGR